jgi:hypothetical protein
MESGGPLVVPTSNIPIRIHISLFLSVRVLEMLDRLLPR